MQKLLIIIFVAAVGLFFAYTPTQQNKKTNEAPLPITSSPTSTEPLATPPKKDTTIIRKINPKEFRIYIANNTSDAQFISGWSTQVTSTETYIINGSYFNEDNEPSGFLVVNGKRVGMRMFDQDKSGLIVLDDKMVRIRDLSKQPIKQNEKFTFALQSYPFLIRDGESAITHDSGKKARRSAIGVDGEGAVYFIFSADPHLTLYTFAQQLEETGIAFQQVLNLDGGPSSGLFIREQGQTRLYNSLSIVPNVIVAQKK